MHILGKQLNIEKTSKSAESLFCYRKHNPHVSKDVAGKGVSHTSLWYFWHYQGARNIVNYIIDLPEQVNQ